MLWHPEDPEAFGRGDECMTVELKNGEVRALRWPYRTREDFHNGVPAFEKVRPPVPAAAFVMSQRPKD